MYRLCGGELEVFLAHPGGPHFARKDEGHWTAPKGETEPGEALLDTAQREFFEETNLTPNGPYIELGWIRQGQPYGIHFVRDYELGEPFEEERTKVPEGALVDD